MANINELLEGHVTLEVEYIDRLLLERLSPPAWLRVRIDPFPHPAFGQAHSFARSAGPDHPRLGRGGEGHGFPRRDSSGSFPARRAPRRSGPSAGPAAWGARPGGVHRRGPGESAYLLGPERRRRLPI